MKMGTRVRSEPEFEYMSVSISSDSARAAKNPRAWASRSALTSLE
jgi:hypothetical protein